MAKKKKTAIGIKYGILHRTILIQLRAQGIEAKTKMQKEDLRYYE